MKTKTTLRTIKAWPDKAINNRVAELFGASFKTCECGLLFCNKEDRWHWPDKSISDYTPDYANDLNACHEMEESIPSNGVRMIWRRNLDKVVGLRRGQSDLKRIWLSTHISARQRCEAFILTMSI